MITCMITCLDTCVNTRLDTCMNTCIGAGADTCPDTCPRCGSGMLPWRHSSSWWAFTCWACHFVSFERAENDVQEMRRADAPVAAASVVQVVRLPRLRLRGDRTG
jgi:ribosomal protein S27AE